MSSTIIILEVQIYENVENDEGALTGSFSDSAAASAGRVKSSSHKQKNRALKSSRIASSQSAKNRWRGPQDS